MAEKFYHTTREKSSDSQSLHNSAPKHFGLYLWNFSVFKIELLRYLCFWKIEPANF